MTPFVAEGHHYFRRLSVRVYPDGAGFGKARWIMLGDVDVEHLFDVFTPIGTTWGETRSACSHFLEHLLWHKLRRTVLRTSIQGLRDDHSSLNTCLTFRGCPT